VILKLNEYAKGSRRAIHFGIGLFVLAMATMGQAALNFTTNNGTIMITAPSCTSGAVIIPITFNNLPVTAIGSYAFSACRSLSNITIPNSITNIGDVAFEYCESLTSITIPGSVSSIGQSTFQGMTNLTSLYFEGNSPNLGNQPFSTILINDTNVTVYYIPGTTNWTNFAQQTGITPVVWKPQVQSCGVQSNCFGFNVNWAHGQTVVVEACTNLLTPTWAPVLTNILTNGSFYFSDVDWMNYPGRYYRVRSP
jgi:hypothetical protein